MFVQEYVYNGHKYTGMQAEVGAHLARCPICLRAYNRIVEEIRQWEEGDIPGYRG